MGRSQLRLPPVTPEMNYGWVEPHYLIPTIPLIISQLASCSAVAIRNSFWKYLYGDDQFSTLVKKIFFVHKCWCPPVKPTTQV